MTTAKKLTSAEMETLRRYCDTLDDGAFQVFKCLIPALVPPELARHGRAVPDVQRKNTS